MAVAALPTLKYHHSLSPSFVIFGNNAQSMPISRNRKAQLSGKSRKIVGCSSNPSRPCLQDGILRRDLMFLGLSSSLSLAFPVLGAGAEEELKMDLFVDETNAYSYLYPKALPSDKFVFKWVESRKPERYSSAAPLSPDARLRIVSERVDFIDNLIISVSIGPPNPLFLKSNDKSTWSAKDVAESVLADKSALRVTTSQRMDESSILDAHSSTVDSEPYWSYEYLVRKSPTEMAPSSNLYRHFVAATAEREGYLYSLNASTLSMQWEKMGPFLEKTVASFRLLPPTENYVPPYKDPWRFW
ncbi:psbP domain-containing protein 5, chloroplastic-like isoform X1 [Salvia hispanica]|uniref:psbP domain-containing protein 5, chloroplastic-like isoform X1 n=1 Tax=Salvia hispanica TaxID=49212 RepID=UPI0020098F38|nr:psbP domain-containing protein 5, chloroplastic-like isoform X1 [Salvia hispanica]